MVTLKNQVFRRTLRLWKTQLPRYASSLLHVETSEKISLKYFDVEQQTYLHKLWQRCQKAVEGEKEKRWKIFFNDEKDYPSLLKNINRPPKVLFWQGSLLTQQAVAVIGCRQPHPSLKQACFSIASHLVQQNKWLLSGLARGCDTFAHQAALAYAGKSLAVLPSGLEKIYPAENRTLAAEILAQGGALCSEYLPDTEVRSWRCIARNRIQSGLSDSIILVASSLQGGSMHTVRFSRQHQRRLYVYPPELLDEELDNSGTSYLLSHHLAKRWTAYQQLDVQKQDNMLFEAGSFNGKRGNNFSAFVKSR